MAEEAYMMDASSPSNESDVSSTQFAESELENWDAGSPVAAPSTPVRSLSAALHGAGACKPCAWYWKPVGCLQGRACDFCHMCPQGELKQRKKAKVAMIKKRLAGHESHASLLERAQDKGFRITIKNTFIHIEELQIEEAAQTPRRGADILTAAGLVFALVGQ